MKISIRLKSYKSYNFKVEDVSMQKNVSFYLIEEVQRIHFCNTFTSVPIYFTLSYLLFFILHIYNKLLMHYIIIYINIIKKIYTSDNSHKKVWIEMNKC